MRITDNETKAKVIEMYRNGDKYEYITAQTGCTPDTIITIAREAGLPPRIKTARNKKKRCDFCGAEIRIKGAKFCPFCGNNVLTKKKS